MVLSKRYFLIVYSKSYLEKYKDMNSDICPCRYMLYEYVLDNDDPTAESASRCIFKTNSKGELKIKLVVYGFKYEKSFTIHKSSFGRYAGIGVKTIV